MHPTSPARPIIGVVAQCDGVRVRVDGDLDAADAPRLDRVLTQVVDAAARDASQADRRGRRVVVDLCAVDLLAAAGMTVLQRAWQEAARRGLEWTVLVSPRARRALALTGLDGQILPSADGEVRAFSATTGTRRS